MIFAHARLLVVVLIAFLDRGPQPLDQFQALFVAHLRVVPAFELHQQAGSGAPLAQHEGGTHQRMHDDVLFHGERVDVGAGDEDEAVVGAAAVRPQARHAWVGAVEVAAVVFVQVRVDGEDGLHVDRVRVADDDGCVLGVAAVPAVAAEVDAGGRVDHDVLPCAVVPGAGGAESGV